jgi:hypothetical protein
MLIANGLVCISLMMISLLVISPITKGLASNACKDVILSIGAIRISTFFMVALVVKYSFVIDKYSLITIVLAIGSWLVAFRFVYMGFLITKTLLKEFLQCPKLAWWHVNHRDVYASIQSNIYGSMDMASV